MNSENGKIIKLYGIFGSYYMLPNNKVWLLRSGYAVFWVLFGAAVFLAANASGNANKVALLAIGASVAQLVAYGFWAKAADSCTKITEAKDDFK